MSRPLCSRKRTALIGASQPETQAMRDARIRRETIDECIAIIREYLGEVFGPVATTKEKGE